MFKELYRRLDTKQFFLLAILICALGDLSIGAMIYFKFTDMSFVRQAFVVAEQELATQGLALNDLSSNFEYEIIELMKKTTATALVIFFVMHAFVYFQFYRYKLTAYYYVKMMVWLGPIFCLMIGYSNATTNAFYFYFYLQAILYFFIARGMGQFPLPAKKKE